MISIQFRCEVLIHIPFGFRGSFQRDLGSAKRILGAPRSANPFKNSPGAQNNRNITQERYSGAQDDEKSSKIVFKALRRLKNTL